MITETLSALELVKHVYSGSKHALEIMNQIKDLEKGEFIVELRKLIISLNEDSLTLREKCLSLVEENAHLKRKIKRKMKLYKEVFWADDGSSDGPFCPKCLQSNDEAEVIIINNDPEKNECWDCSVCGKTFRSKEATLRSWKKHHETVRSLSGY